MVGDHPEHELVHAVVLGLNQQALLERARSDAKRVELLDHRQDFFGIFRIEVCLRCEPRHHFIGRQAFDLQIAVVVEVTDHEPGKTAFVLDEVAHANLPSEMIVEVFGDRKSRFEPGHLVVRSTPDRRHRRFVRLVLEVALPVDLVFLLLVRLDLGRSQLFGPGRIRVSSLRTLFEHGIFEQLLLHELGELHARHLQ